MVSIKNTLLSLATVVAVTSTDTYFHTAADLTPKDAAYDGMALYALFTLGEIETLVDTQKNATFMAEFVKAKKEIVNQANLGVLNAQAYTCTLYTFYKSANVAYQDFSGYVDKNLPNVVITTEKFIKRAPTFWWDFYSDILSTVATNTKNKQLTSLYTAMDTKVEADIKAGASASTILDKSSAFVASADALVPTYSTKVADMWTASTTNIVLNFKASAICPGVPPLTTSPPTTEKPTTTPSPTSKPTTKPPTATPSPTATRTTTTETPVSPVPTASEANPISLEIMTPAPTAAKAIATTTAPPAKSSTSKTASTVASAVIVLVAFAASSLI